MKSSPRVVNKPVALITARFRLADKTYRRSQVEWALWKFATLDLPRGDEPVSTFRARIKHLLQLDRAGVMFSRTRHAPHVEHALSSHDTEGSGFDAIFTAFDTLRLGLALDFMRAGFKQSEILVLIGHLRPRLNQPYAAILRSPPLFRPHFLGKSGAREEARRGSSGIFGD